MDFGQFFANYGLLIMLAALLVFMFWSTRRRMAKQKSEAAARARQTIPGAEVLLQGGLYGMIVSYDADNLDEPAVVQIAPGVEIKVHSQAILRVVAPIESDLDDTPVLGSHEDIPAEDSDSAFDENNGSTGSTTQ